MIEWLQTSFARDLLFCLLTLWPAIVILRGWGCRWFMQGCCLARCCCLMSGIRHLRFDRDEGVAEVSGVAKTEEAHVMMIGMELWASWPDWIKYIYLGVVWMVYHLRDGSHSSAARV